MSENIIEIVNTDVIVQIQEDSYSLNVDNLITYDYSYCQNKPSVNNVTLVGNKSSSDLGLASADEILAKENLVNKVTEIDENSTDVEYPSAKCLYDELLNKADVNLSNINGTQSNNFDGHWVASYLELIGSSTTINGQTTLDFSLENYLPNDGNIYDVRYYAIGRTGTTSGSYAEISVNSSIISSGYRVATANTLANGYQTWCGSGTMPIGTDRKIKITNIAAGACTCLQFRIFAYRRIGTNS